ncbi:demethoxyubiquinone hydroxylase family protein [Massilia agri]|uniref:Demethoxyubiquinone hydroxylase family protein n=1 Tax=Massilia agri TaxID=1886785 RepID=A0ABT2AG46_9BURK|nr:demethoxyubiquinone hydroxylase family protein [Massilia agri]MCS0595145.1 demethoxyubiquinone hydroxylase family protein [Massilia agri]
MTVARQSLPLSAGVDAGRILKVNHAGEHGAVHIYAGQILAARLRASRLTAELAEFKAHEEKHRAIFGHELERRGLRKCRSFWMCAVGGYGLGILSGLMGEQAIAITTVAVERVVLRHLHGQLAELGASDPAATTAILQILDDEQHHHDRSAIRLHAPGLLYRALERAVSGATEAVIWIGMRV